MSAKDPQQRNGQPNGDDPAKQEPSEWQRFNDLAGKLLRVSKNDLDAKRKKAKR
jgi:hypothetical protein